MIKIILGYSGVLLGIGWIGYRIYKGYMRNRNLCESPIKKLIQYVKELLSFLIHPKI